jgi:hypothetical protein
MSLVHIHRFLIPFGWLHSSYANPYLFHYFIWEYCFWIISFWFMPTLSGTQLRCKARAWCNGCPFKYSVFCRVHEVNMELCHCTGCPVYAVSFHRMLTVCIIVWYRVVSLCGSNTSSENRDRRLKFWQQFYNGNTVSLLEYNQIRSTCKAMDSWYPLCE